MKKKACFSHKKSLRVADSPGGRRFTAPLDHFWLWRWAVSVCTGMQKHLRVLTAPFRCSAEFRTRGFRLRQRTVKFAADSSHLQIKQRRPRAEHFNLSASGPRSWEAENCLAVDTGMSGDIFQPFLNKSHIYLFYFFPRSHSSLP